MPEDMVGLSKRFIGLPYLWGGTSPLGFDCSGFVQLIYKMGGVPILRDADIQFEGSGLKEVSAGQESAGDLVFFGRAKDKIAHVGMMINGEEFINATVHDKPVVQISRLKDAYWQGIYQGARRAAGR
jgi:cell wall-associated NlpC family hydrolase